MLVIGLTCAVLSLPLILGWLPAQLFRGATSHAFQITFGSWWQEVSSFFRLTGDLLIYQLIGYQPSGWLWPWLPEWTLCLVGLVLIGLGALKARSWLLSLSLFSSFLLYYAMGRSGAYPYGGRYSLILVPMYWSLLSVGIGSVSRVSRALGVLILTLLLIVSTSAPAESQEDLRSVTEFWLSRRKPGEATYVYYGAVPGFGYQRQLAGDEDHFPPLWYIDCWSGNQAPHCAEDGVYYGRWIRSLTREEQLRSLQETLPQSADRLWLVLSHVHGDEGEALIAGFETDYCVVADHKAENARVVLFDLCRTP